MNDQWEFWTVVAGMLLLIAALVYVQESILEPQSVADTGCRRGFVMVQGQCIIGYKP